MKIYFTFYKLTTQQHTGKIKVLCSPSGNILKCLFTSAVSDSAFTETHLGEYLVKKWNRKKVYFLFYSVSIINYLSIAGL